MEPTDQLQVNLTSQDDIRAKLPEARRIYRAKIDALRVLRREVENWAKLVELLAQLAGEPETVEAPDGGTDTTRAQTRATKKESPAQDRAIAALHRAGKPMGPTALYMAVCTATDLPLTWNLRTARENESLHALALIDATRTRGFAAETCAMDKGYDLATVHDGCEDRGCRPIIPLRQPPT
jgi:hypothetical protein